MEIIKIADRMKNVHSDIRGPLFVEAMDMRARGIDVLRLNTGNPATFGFKMPESLENALKGHEQKGVAYCDFKGMPEARQAICEFEKGKGIEGITPDDVFIGNGVSEVVNFALMPLLNDGDEVLVPSPSYSLWGNSVYLASGKPVFYVCDEKSEWNPDIADIRSKVTSKTKAIVLINPNNPTGALYSDDMLKQLVQVARENGLIIFADEIYDRLVFEGEKHTAIASFAPDILTVCFNGLSKSHNIPGFRAGWMCLAGDKTKAKGYISGLNLLSTMRLCSNVPAQSIIQTALGGIQSCAHHFAPGGRIFEQREYIYKALNEIPGISAVKPKGAFYIFPKIDTEMYGIKDDEQFALDLLKETHILVTKGTGFNWHKPDHFRIVFLPEARKLEKAIGRISRFLEEYHQ